MAAAGCHPARGRAERSGGWALLTAGTVAADAIAVAVGAILGTRLPERYVRLFAAAAFVLFGLLLIARGVGLI